MALYDLGKQLLVLSSREGGCDQAYEEGSRVHRVGQIGYPAWIRNPANRLISTGRLPAIKIAGTLPSDLRE